MTFTLPGLNTAGWGPVNNAALTNLDNRVTNLETGISQQVGIALVLPNVGTYTYNTDGTVASGPLGETYTYNTDGTVHTVTYASLTRTFSYNTDGTIAGVA